MYFSTHMQDLQEVTQEVHYENYRSERLAKGTPARKIAYVIYLTPNWKMLDVFNKEKASVSCC